MTLTRRLCLLMIALTVTCCCRDWIPGKESGWKLDTAHAVVAMVKASTGGTLSTTASNGTASEVRIPGGALGVDTELELIPVSKAGVHDERTIDSGVVVRKKGDKSVFGHLPLARKATIRLTVKGAKLEHASLVRYGDDGGSYQPIATTVGPGNGAVVLQATVGSFSGYGARQLEPEEEPEEREWVIVVNDTIRSPIPEWNMNVRLSLLARSTGDHTGPFQGPAAMTVEGNATKAVGPAVAKAVASGQMTGPAQIGVLTPQDDIRTGTGSITGQGKGSVTGSGHGPNVRINPITTESEGASTTAFQVRVDSNGKVTLTVPNQGEFHGVMRMHKKKQKKCEEELGKLTPEQQEKIKQYSDPLKVRDQSFKNLDDATRAAGKSIQGACNGTSYEWGGAICRDGKGQYRVVPGGDSHCGTDFTPEGVNTGALEGCPDGMIPAAAFHCHPKGIGSKKASDGDKENADEAGLEATVVIFTDGDPDQMVVYDKETGDRPPVDLK